MKKKAILDLTAKELVQFLKTLDETPFINKEQDTTSTDKAKL